ASFTGMMRGKSLPTGQSAPEYPDAPFRPVGKDFPRIIPVKEAPTFAEFQAVLKVLRETGAIRNATAGERDAVLAVDFYRPFGDRANYPRGRDLAEKALQSNPASIPGLYALAQVQFHGEG